MNIKKFPNPKLNLPKDLKKKAKEDPALFFKYVDNYINLVGKYIYTDINLDYQPVDDNHIHAWIQRIVSANLLRSLYIRNEFVETINTRNFVGMFLPLKAWFEIVGVLASILDLLEKKLSKEDLREKLEPYCLGNRGITKIGEVESINVLTMINKANRYLEKMQKEVQNKDKASPETFFTSFYDTASNPSHPSFDSMEMVGFLDEESGTWRAELPDNIKEKIVTSIDGYGGLLMSPLFIENICQKIFLIEKDKFFKLKSKKYFD